MRISADIPAVLLHKHHEDTLGSKFDMHPVSIGESLSARVLSSFGFFFIYLLYLIRLQARISSLTKSWFCTFMKGTSLTGVRFSKLKSFSEKIRGELQPLSSNIDLGNSYKVLLFQISNFAEI
jgi:hypothetical protein